MATRKTPPKPKINVTFEAPYRGFSPGESGGLDPVEARSVVSRKIGRYTNQSGHAPLNAAVMDSTSKSDPAVREALREKANESDGETSEEEEPLVVPEDVESLTYNALRSLSAEIRRRTGLEYEGLDRDSLLAYVRENS